MIELTVRSAGKVPLSVVLHVLPHDASRDRVAVTDLLDALGDRALAALMFVLAVPNVLPVPLGDMLPALSISLLALGILERDGLWVLAGLAAAVASGVRVAGVIDAMVEAAIFLFTEVRR